MLDRIWEFLFPSNSNSKNRNEIFLWFLACFIIAMGFTFWNGYQIGKCKCVDEVSNSTTVKNLQEDTLRMRKDSAQIKADISLLVSKINYDEYKNSEDRAKISTLKTNIDKLTVKDESLQIIQNILSNTLSYKYDLISIKEQNMQGMDSLITLKRIELKAASDSVSDKWAEFRKALRAVKNAAPK